MLICQDHIRTTDSLVDYVQGFQHSSPAILYDMRSMVVFVLLGCSQSVPAKVC